MLKTQLLSVCLIPAAMAIIKKDQCLLSDSQKMLYVSFQCNDFSQASALQKLDSEYGSLWSLFHKIWKDLQPIGKIN